jgi:hypothetical protein
MPVGGAHTPETVMLLDACRQLTGDEQNIQFPTGVQCDQQKIPPITAMNRFCSPWSSHSPGDTLTRTPRRANCQHRRRIRLRAAYGRQSELI